MIKAIVFDMGGVIIHFDENKYYEYLSEQYDINENKIVNAMTPLINRFDRGDITLGLLLDSISKNIGIKIPRKSWNLVFDSNAKIDGKMIALIGALSKNYKIYMLTNVNRSRYFRTNIMLKINEKLFDKKFISCYLHMTKPDKRIYQYLLAKTKLMPNETVFIDDSLANINGARAIGMNGIVFKGYDALVSELKRINIL